MTGAKSPLGGIWLDFGMSNEGSGLGNGCWTAACGFDRTADQPPSGPEGAPMAHPAVKPMAISKLGRGPRFPFILAGIL